MRTDTELIAAVAKLKGWEECYAHDSKTWFWCDSGDGVYSKTELPTTDQCLALLDKGQNAKIEYYPHHSFVEIEDVEHDDPIAKADDKFLPRAILLALLEVE